MQHDRHTKDWLTERALWIIDEALALVFHRRRDGRDALGRGDLAMNGRKQLITPMMTDEEAQQIARRTMLAVEALGFIAFIVVCLAIYIAVPA